MVYPRGTGSKQVLLKDAAKKPVTFFAPGMILAVYLKSVKTILRPLKTILVAWASPGMRKLCWVTR